MHTMSLLAFGINHKTAPVDIREQVAFAPENIHQALKDLTTRPEISEAAILSTCNRTELYCEVEENSSEVLINWFQQYHRLGSGVLDPYIYIHPGQSAVEHVLRVACGLDSMVLGEPQILGQLKDAYAEATHAGTAGLLLNRLFQHTFSVAKHVRTDTAIGASAVSVAFAAVSLAKQIFGELSDSSVLLIGAGETIELVARHLKENGVKEMVFANRTVERARLLADQYNATAIALSDMPAYLPKSDIVVSSTASQLPILGKGTVESAIKLRKHKPIFMVDIAVPRDIEPEVSELEDVYLYSVDDLHEIIDENLKSRQEAAEQAQEIIEVQTQHFMNWLQSLEAVDTIRAYREKAQNYRNEVLNKALRDLARGVPAEEVLTEMSRLLTNKLIHDPSVRMRLASYEGNDELLKAARTLFDLTEN